jgi:hypothetical protein
MGPTADASELTGAAALVWQALEHPCTLADLEAVADGAPVEEALTPLLDAGMVEEVS